MINGIIKMRCGKYLIRDEYTSLYIVISTELRERFKAYDAWDTLLCKLFGNDNVSKEYNLLGNTHRMFGELKSNKKGTQYFEVYDDYKCKDPLHVLLKQTDSNPHHPRVVGEISNKNGHSLWCKICEKQDLVFGVFLSDWQNVVDIEDI